jgi:hypothetical protein
MYVHTYGICHMIQKTLSVCSFPAYIKRGFDFIFLRILDILCLLNVFLPYFIRILAHFSTYVCILRKIQALYGCIRILRMNHTEYANIHNLRYGYGI